MRQALMLGSTAVLLATASAAAQGEFEGMVAYKFSEVDGGEMRIYQQGTKMRQEMEVKQGNRGMASIYDGVTGDAVVLMAEQRRYMKMNRKSMGKMQKSMAGAQESPDFSKLTVTPTGESETIAGIECDHYIFESTDEKKSSRIDICGAKGMGFLGTGEHGGGPMATSTLLKAQNPELAKLAKSGFFPLKMTVKEGKKTVTMEATKVEQKKLDAAMFAIPAGYTEFKMPGMPTGS